MKYSVLNLVPLREGETYGQAYEAMVRLAQQAENLGYERYWLAEHHNTPTVGSSATAQLIQHVLGHTSSIRVGAGGVMLPNHNPYVVAEQYGTLAVLYPDRVDLGLGRAPGTDQRTAQALRRQNDRTHLFQEEVAELLGYFQGANPVQAYPAKGLRLPVYVLGSSIDSAYLAAEQGLPYVFAAHFAPGQLEAAVQIYRANFKPSPYLEQPYVIVGANAAVADSDEKAESLATSQVMAFLNLVTGQARGLREPLVNTAAVWEERLQALYASSPNLAEHRLKREQEAVAAMLKVSFVGSPATLAQQIKELKAKVAFDELMVTSYIYDEKAQHRSLELLAQVLRKQ